MAIAFFGTATEIKFSTTASELSGSHTVPTGQSDTILVVSVHLHDDADDISSGTYGGQSLTSAGVGVENTGSNLTRTEIWYLVNPPTGSNTLTLTLGSSAFCAGCVAVQYSGVHQTTPIGGTDTDAAGSSSTTATVVNMTDASGVHIHAATILGQDGSPASASAGTERADGSTGASNTNDVAYHLVEHAPGSTGNNTITTTWSVTDFCTSSGIELLPAAASQTIYTRLGQHGGPAADWPGFEAKATVERPVTGQLTRLGLYGGPRENYPAFVAKGAAAASADAILLHKSRLITPRLIRTLGDCD